MTHGDGNAIDVGPNLTINEDGRRIVFGSLILQTKVQDIDTSLCCTILHRLGRDIAGNEHPVVGCCHIRLKAIDFIDIGTTTDLEAEVVATCFRNCQLEGLVVGSHCILCVLSAHAEQLYAGGSILSVQNLVTGCCGINHYLTLCPI